jgi:hypothetical protein
MASRSDVMKSGTWAANLAVAAASLALLAGCTAAATPSPSTTPVEPSASPSKTLARPIRLAFGVAGRLAEPELCASSGLAIDPAGDSRRVVCDRRHDHAPR